MWFQTDKTNILLVMHRIPDGDAVASAYVVKEILKLKYRSKKFFVVADDHFKVPFPDHLNLNDVTIVKNKEIPDNCCAFILDHSDREYSLLWNWNDPRITETVIIDHHHYFNSATSNSKLLIDDKARSTCEILYEYLENRKFNLMNVDIATALYIGIFSDSLYWQTPLTERIFEIINDLIKNHGVEADKYNLFLRGKYFIYKRAVSEMIFLHSNKSHRSNTVTFIINNQKFEKCKRNYIGIPHLINEVINCRGVNHVIARYEYFPDAWAVRILTRDWGLMPKLNDDKIYRPNYHTWTKLNENQAKTLAKNIRDRLARWEAKKEPENSWENIIQTEIPDEPATEIE